MDTLVDDLWPQIVYELTDGVFDIGPHTMRAEWATPPLYFGKDERRISMRDLLGPDARTCRAQFRRWQETDHATLLVKWHQKCARRVIILAQCSATLWRLMLPLFNGIYRTMSALFHMELYQGREKGFLLPLPAFSGPIIEPRPEWFAYAVYGLVYNEQERQSTLVHFKQVKKDSMNVDKKRLVIYVDSNYVFSVHDPKHRPQDGRPAYYLLAAGHHWHCPSPDHYTVKELLASSAEYEAITKRANHIQERLRFFTKTIVPKKPMKKKQKKE